MPGDTPFDAALAALAADGHLDAVRAAHRAEVDALRDKLTRVLGAIQRLQPNGSPIPGDEAVVAEWIVGEVVSARATHRAEVERAVDALSARVAKLEAALRFYAEPDVYIFRETTDDGGITPVLVINDGGAKARAALEEPCKGDSPEAAEEDKS